MIKSLARLDSIKVLDQNDTITKDMVQGSFSGGVFLMPLKGIVDVQAERARLQKELSEIEGRLKGYAAKLSNESFVSRAPTKVVEEEKRRQSEALEQLSKVQEALNRIKDL